MSKAFAAKNQFLPVKSVKWRKKQTFSMHFTTTHTNKENGKEKKMTQERIKKDHHT